MENRQQNSDNLLLFSNEDIYRNQEVKNRRNYELTYECKNGIHILDMVKIVDFINKSEEVYLIEELYFLYNRNYVMMVVFTTDKYKLLRRKNIVYPIIYDVTNDCIFYDYWEYKGHDKLSQSDVINHIETFLTQNELQFKEYIAKLSTSNYSSSKNLEKLKIKNILKAFLSKMQVFNFKTIMDTAEYKDAVACQKLDRIETLSDSYSQNNKKNLSILSEIEQAKKDICNAIGHQIDLDEVYIDEESKSYNVCQCCGERIYQRVKQL